MILNVPMEFEISFSPEDEMALEDLEDSLKRDPLLQPARAVSDAPYSAYVEFGTKPAQSHSDRNVKEELRRWAKEKLNATDAKADWIAGFVYWKILHTGMLPMPFFRPAIIDTMMEVREDWLDKGNSLRDIAEAIIWRARNNLERNDQNWTGTLHDGLTIEDSKGPIQIDENMPPEGEIDERIWESDRLSWDGHSVPNPGRWQR